MTRFRGCIDIHSGVVKQIVGGTLKDSAPDDLKTNFVAKLPAEHFANLYKDHGITGAHVIMLGPGCTEAAEKAVKAWPNALQVGGGINSSNARSWLEKGAEKVIITSYLFPDATFSQARLEEVLSAVGGKDKLVIDLSCRRQGSRWIVAMNRWQTMTDMEVNKATLDLLSQYCSEFLIHAADVEGLCRGIDEELVTALGDWVIIPTTYAGGAKNIDDLERVHTLSGGKVDLTYGSALDIFGGELVRFEDCVEWNNQHQ